MVEVDKTILSIIHKEEGLEVRINEAAYGNVAVIGLLEKIKYTLIAADEEEEPVVKKEVTISNQRYDA
jgi:hypothetical protein